MRRISRVVASALGLALALSACSGGHNSTLPSLASPDGASGATQTAVTHSNVSDTPLTSIPQMYGKLAFTDSGRHPKNAIVRVSITLKYNNQNELDQLVAKLNDPRAGKHRRFLSPNQFN